MPCFTAKVSVECHALLSLTTEKLEQLHKTILMEQKKNTFYSEVSTGILGVYYSDVASIGYTTYTRSIDMDILATNKILRK